MGKFTFIKKTIFTALLASISLNAYSNTEYNAENSELYYVTVFDTENKDITIIPLNQQLFLNPSNVILRNAWVYTINKNKKLKYDLLTLYAQVDCNSMGVRFFTQNLYLKGKLVKQENFPNDASNKFLYFSPISKGGSNIHFLCNFETILLSDKGKENIYSLPKDTKQLVKNIQEVLFSE